MFPLVLLLLAPLFLLLVDPAATGAADENVTTTEEKVQPLTPVSSPIRGSGRARTVTVDGLLEGQNYFIKRPAMGTGLTYEYKDESRTSNGTTVKDSYHRFKERVRLQTNGWVYHPALMQYFLMVEPEWIQSKEVNTTGETGSVASFTPDYALTTTFLQEKPYTLNVFASRRQAPVWAAFAGSTDSIVDSYGTTIRLKNKILATSFGYTHVEMDQTGYYTSANIRDDFHLNSSHQIAKSNTNFSSTYSDDKRSTEGIDTAITTFNNSLINNFQVTDDNRVTLNSFLTYRAQETEGYNTNNFRLREDLNWQHRSNLQSNYAFTHNLLETNDSQTEQTSLDARLTHLLYENLSTSLGTRGNRYDYSGGRENSIDTFLDFRYTRPLSWGTLSLNSGWDYRYTNRGGFTSATAQVSNETHPLSPTTETFLDNYNVQPGTIVVTNTAGTIVYIEDIDYSVDTIDNTTRITYLPFGSIVPGQSVNVSYSYVRDGEYDDTIFTENYGISTIILNDWQFSYNYLQAKQNIISGQAPDNLINDTIHRAKLRYNRGWSDTTLDYEDNNRQSSRPYTLWKIQETLSFRPLWQIHFALKGYLGQTTYLDQDEIKEFYGGVTTFDWILDRRCRFRLEGYYNSINGDVEQTENAGIKAGLEFRYRIWTARISYELTDQNNISTDYGRNKQLFRLELIRIMW